MTRGRFITIEGMEGVGKTTNIGIVEGVLRRAGIDFVTTREPGGTPLAEKIRQLLLARDTEPLAPMAELLLMFAARAQHVHRCILPALEQGKWVVCDRFTDSTYAYQGGGRGLDEQVIGELEALAIERFEPDLTLLLDLPPATGMARAEHRGEKDRFESEDLEFFERVRRRYLDRARDNSRIRVIDASSNLPTVAAEITAVLETAFGPELHQ